jgi:fibronectin type 3 domain-containing protein
MNIKRFLLAGCSVVVLSAGTALAGPCDTTGRTANSKDAGSGPASQSTSQTVGTGNDSKEHPPTSTMNRASGEVAASSQDAQRQMQGQPTAAQQTQGAKPGAEMGTQEAQRQMHAQPSVAMQPKGTNDDCQ